MKTVSHIPHFSIIPTDNCPSTSPVSAFTILIVAQKELSGPKDIDSVTEREREGQASCAEEIGFLCFVITCCL